MEELNRNVSITVGTDNTVISEEKNILVMYRRFISIINTSTGGQVISVSPTDEAVAGQGIPLTPGGFYIESEDAGFKPTNARICAISSAAGGTLAVSERVVTL